MSRISWSAGILLGVAILASPGLARAFCLTHGCSDRTQRCEYDDQGCLLPSSGPRLYWASSCVSFDVQQDGSALRALSYGDARKAIRQGFAEWLSADCGDGQGPSIDISDFGPVECRTAEYNQEGPNANVFMFRDDEWPYDNALDTLALTTLIFNADTGEIYDADVEVNTFESRMSVNDVGRDDIDFRSVITHEIGHFLGLSHSNVEGATMEPNYGKGQTGMASIEQDDVDGICAALPPERKTTSDSCEPRHSFSSQCALEETSCQLAPGAPGGWLSALLALGGLSSTLLRTRLRRAGRRRAANPCPRSDQDSAS
jgi:hypothetical protein